MAKRRGNQDGTFYQRSNGTWCGQIMINNKRYTVYAKGIQECRVKLRAKVNEINMMSSPQIPFSVYANKIIDDQVENNIIKQSTARIKKMSISCFIRIVGDMPLSDINKDVLNRFTSHLIQEHKSHTTIVTYVGFVMSIIRNAYNEELINKPISSDVINKGPQTRNRRILPTLEQMKEIIESYTDERKVLLYLMLYSGIRGGEAVVLKWSDIDIDRCKIYINRGVNYINKEYILSTPKSNRIGEYAQFSQKFQPILLQYKESSTPFNGDFLFDYLHGKTRLHSLTASVCSKLRDIGCKGGLHTLRHLHASILLNNGIDLKTIQSQLRHASIETTNKYLHELEEDMRTSIRNLSF